MRRTPWYSLLSLLLLLHVGTLRDFVSVGRAAEPASGSKAMVATVHPLASAAGVDALRRGGNAIDAAVAAALTLGVADPHNSGLGGGCFVLIRLADGRVVAVDGRETAPARATRDMYLRDGMSQGELSRTGALASGVPGALAAYHDVVGRFGRLQLADLLLPAAEIAERGFRVSGPLAGALRREAEDLAKFDAAAAAWLKPDGSPYRAGETLRRRDLARTYRAIARNGVGWFYRGPFAERTERWMAANGGILTADDFAAYRVRHREPIRSTYRGYEILGFPPPSSGGIHVAQILNMLERFDLRQIEARSPGQLRHVLAETMKLAFADRTHWLGDADFTDVPRGLIDRRYAAEQARRIDLEQVIEVRRHGLPPGWKHDHFGSPRHTTHVAAADRHGNWVAITATLNTWFGSKVVVPGTGVVLNNQMDDFSIAPGIPNAFGLLGSKANAVAPGKRPLSSMSPTIVLRGGRPILTLGASGGPKIITQVVQVIVRHLDLGRPLPEAVAAARVHHQWMPDKLLIEESLDEAIAADLARRGHVLKRSKFTSALQVIGRAADGKTLIGVADPRVGGKAAGL